MLITQGGQLYLDGKPVTAADLCASGYSYYCQEHILAAPAKMIDTPPDEPTILGGLGSALPTTCTNCQTKYLAIAAAALLVFLVLK